MKILLLNGPNLNLLGTREPERYGRQTLAELVEQVRARAAQLGVSIVDAQSNHEGVLIEHVHEAWRRGVAGAVVNAAAYTHTSVALRDALLATRLPFVEVHLSNVFAREEFRHKSLLADVAVGCVVGLGARGYGLALEGLVEHLRADVAL